jgi:hypothetical protein
MKIHKQIDIAKGILLPTNHGPENANVVRAVRTCLIEDVGSKFLKLIEAYHLSAQARMKARYAYLPCIATTMVSDRLVKTILSR